MLSVKLLVSYTSNTRNPRIWFFGRRLTQMTADNRRVTTAGQYNHISHRSELQMIAGMTQISQNLIYAVSDRLIQCHLRLSASICVNLRPKNGSIIFANGISIIHLPIFSNWSIFYQIHILVNVLWKVGKNEWADNNCNYRFQINNFTGTGKVWI